MLFTNMGTRYRQSIFSMLKLVRNWVGFLTVHRFHYPYDPAGPGRVGQFQCEGEMNFEGVAEALDSEVASKKLFINAGAWFFFVAEIVFTETPSMRAQAPLCEQC